MWTGGTVIAGYRLESLLGEGGMGTVWSAVEIESGTRRALKFLKGAATEGDRRRFLREARAAMGLAHAGIIRVHTVIADPDGLPVIVMDLLEGESLAARLARQGKLPLAVFADIFAQVLSAVGTAHAAGIVHRDLKPENIFLVRSAQDSVRVLDFGIAKLVKVEPESAQSAALTATGALMGTPYYMSPEQIYGERDTDHRSDIWSLGVILYECLAGVRPFHGENFGQLLKAITLGDPVPLEARVPGLPSDVIEIGARMLSRKPSERPNDLREVQAVFRRHTPLEVVDFLGATIPAQASSGEHALPHSQETGGGTFADATRSRRRSRGGIAIVAIAAIAIGAYFGVHALSGSTTTKSGSDGGIAIEKAPAIVSVKEAPIAQPPSVVATASASVIPTTKPAKTAIAIPKSEPSASVAPSVVAPLPSVSSVPSAKASAAPGLAKGVPF